MTLIKVKQIDWVLTARLNTDVLPLLLLPARRLATAVNIYVTNCKTGQANMRGNTIRIPSWAFNPQVNFCGKGHIQGGLGFVAYYLAHELAHIKAKSNGHGSVFMVSFKELCPASLQWYETIYKPRNATAAGISYNTTIKESK